MLHMTHDWLRLARELGGRSDEAARRAAVSRAYYAAYHRCLDWEKGLPARGRDKGAKGVHACLIARLQQPAKSCSRVQIERSRAMGKLLLSQRQRRVTADYRLEHPLPMLVVEEQLLAADWVLGECDQPHLLTKADPRHRPSRRR